MKTQRHVRLITRSTMKKQIVKSVRHNLTKINDERISVNIFAELQRVDSFTHQFIVVFVFRFFIIFFIIKFFFFQSFLFLFQHSSSHLTYFFHFFLTCTMNESELSVSLSTTTVNVENQLDKSAMTILINMIKSCSVKKLRKCTHQWIM